MNDLNVASTPINGVPILITEPVPGEQPVTPFSRTYEDGTAVALEAPERFQYRYFIEWQLSGATFSTERLIAFDLNNDMQLTAVYGPPTKLLTVQSTPTSGVPINNEDIEIIETPYVREYSDPVATTAVINAPTEHEGRPFGRWLLDARVVSTFHVIHVEMDTDHTLVAEYGEGSITVRIKPREARRGGARWRLDGGTWLKHNVTVEHVPLGKHLIEFKPIDGFETSPKRRVPIVADSELVIRGRYFPVE
jgi:hypothetical protein